MCNSPPHLSGKSAHFYKPFKDMHPFKVLLYTPLMPLGVPTHAYFSGQRLHVAALPQTLDITQLTATLGGIEQDEWFIAWRNDADESCALKLASANDLAIFKAHAPALLLAQLKQTHRHQRFNKTLAAALVAAVLLVTCGLWWGYGKAVYGLSSLVSITREEQFGSLLLAQLEAEGSLAQTGPALEAIKQIGAQLALHSPYHYQWRIKTDPTANAYALPGGIIVVHSGLLAKMANANELAAVLAHEVQHVEQRHALQNLLDNLGWGIAVMAVLGDVSTPIGLLTHQLGSLYFSRDKEEQADHLGYLALTDAGIAPEGMLTLLQKLAQEPQAAPAWLSSHPDSHARIENIQQLLKQHPCTHCQPLALDWDSIKQIPASPK